MGPDTRALAVHLAVIALLIGCWFVLPQYHTGNLARILVLATFASAYNLVFGYTGLLSLGHALFFAAGMYGLGIVMQHGGVSALPAWVFGVACAATVGLVTGALALRTSGVAFMIVTLMFAQAGYLCVLYFGDWTRGDEGFVIARTARNLIGIDLADERVRYFAGVCLFGSSLLGIGQLVRSGFGKTLIAIRENEERARMLGYDVQRCKLIAVVISAALAGAAGAAYALLFGYVGASFAAVQYSILPLLWTLLGGAGTTLGPLLGTLVMFYLVDYASDITDAYLLVVGVALILATLFLPQGIVGTLRRRVLRWLP